MKPEMVEMKPVGVKRAAKVAVEEPDLVGAKWGLQSISAATSSKATSAASALTALE